MIKNFDGGAVTVAPPLWGPDNNRNFPVQWGPDWKQSGAGAYPLPEPETRALADFLIAHPNIHGSQHYHTFSGVILRPSSLRNDDDLPKPDVRIFKALGELGTEETGYRCVSIFQGFAYDKKVPIMGSLTDWTYEQLGLYSLATELWSLPLQAGLEVKDFIKWFEERSEDDDLAMLKVLDRQFDGVGFERWTPFQHTQLGDVEIGGWEFKYTFQNPPGPLLEEECRMNAGFTIWAMGAAPRIEIPEAEAEPLGANLYRVHMLIENTGFLPTNGSEAY